MNTNNHFQSRMILAAVIFFYALTAPKFTIAQSSQDSLFNQFLQQQQEGIKDQEEQFLQYQEKVTAEYQKYEEEQKKAYQDYVDNIAKKWGEQDTKTSTEKEWVSYDKDYSARHSVNFEKGEAKVEVLMTEVEAKNKEAVQQKLKEELTKMATDKGTEDPLEVKEKAKQEDKPILTEQLQMPDLKPVTEKNAQKFAEQIVSVTVTKQEEVKGKDGEKRIAIIITIPLVPDHLKKRADKFKEDVFKEAKRFQLDPTLMFAVVHTESYFNPKARSGVPAYGLMQLVPKSAARDAYLFVYKEDKLLTPDYLYEAGNNVELGAAYLNLLMTKYFKDVKDERSRLYCVVAAYNTGAGNVCKAFTGKTKLKPAIAKMNEMTSDEVMERLKTNLPYKETQDYVVHVTERMPIYAQYQEK